MRSALSVADVLVAPTAPFPPFLTGIPADPASLLLNDVLTVPVSLAGVPAISIPVATAPAATIPVREGVRGDETAHGTGLDGGHTGDRSPRASATGRGGGDTGVSGNAEASGDGRCWLPLGMQVDSCAVWGSLFLHCFHNIVSTIVSTSSSRGGRIRCVGTRRAGKRDLFYYSISSSPA